MVERGANSSKPKSADLNQEELQAQQNKSQATCDPAERASLEIQARPDGLARDEKTGCKVHYFIDRRPSVKNRIEHDSPDVGSPESRARNYLEDE